MKTVQVCVPLSSMPMRRTTNSYGDVAAIVPLISTLVILFALSYVYVVVPLDVVAVITLPALSYMYVMPEAWVASMPAPVV